MNSTREGLFRGDIEGELLNQSYRDCYISNNPDLRKCAILFNQIIRHLQMNTIFSISQLINRFIIENNDLGSLKRYTLVTFLDFDLYIRYKQKL